MTAALSLPGLARGAAVFSPCERYRYRLSREWGAPGGRSLLFVGVNPSTATADRNDPTIRRCIVFAQQWGYASLLVGNLFAFRATDPEVMKAHDRPIGHRNDHHLMAMVAEATTVLAAWGNHGCHKERGPHVLQLIRSMGVEPWCFRLTKLGQPEHPLYQRNDAALVRVADAQQAADAAEGCAT